MGHILLRFKNLNDKRFSISTDIGSRGGTKWSTVIAHNAFDASEHIAIVVIVDMITCAKSSIKIEDERIEKFLIETALKHTKNMIDLGTMQDQKIELSYDDLVSIDYKLSTIKSPETEYMLRARIQKDILACAYKHYPIGAASKELINYVWCDSAILSDELWYLDQRGFIFNPSFDKEILDQGGNDDKKSTVVLTAKGKEEYENILKKAAVQKETEEKNLYNIHREKVKYKEKINNDNHYKCLVILPIGDKRTIQYKNNIAVFNDIIKPCVENSGYNIKCYYSDLISESGGIDKQVIKALRDDAIVIADLRRNNPSVSYELGIRHAFGKRSILICSSQADHFFYTAGYRAIEYKIDGSSNQEFYDKLSEYIKRIIENPLKADNPVTDSIDVKTLLSSRSKLQGGDRYMYLHRIVKGHYSLGELYNMSNEDLIDLDIRLEYIDKSGVEQKRIGKVINSFDDPIRAKSYIEHLIKRKESKHVINFPRTAVKVIVMGRKAESGNKFKEEFDIPAKQADEMTSDDKLEEFLSEKLKETE